MDDQLHCDKLISVVLFNIATTIFEPEPNSIPHGESSFRCDMPSRIPFRKV